MQKDTYRVEYRLKSWVGRPDPEGVGIAHVGSSDTAWIHAKACELHREGCRGISIQRWDGARYRTI